MLKLRHKTKDTLTAYLFVLPWVIGFLLFTILPIIFMVRTSFTDRKLNGLENFVAWENYIRIFNSKTFRTSFTSTLIFTFGSVIISGTWALTLALLLNIKQKYNRVFQFFYFVPAVIPSIALAYSFRTIFGKDSGLLNGLLENFGLPHEVNWLYDKNTVHFAVFLVVLFTYSTGQMMMIFRNGLNEVPNELYESASIDGASFINNFISITLPMISPIILFNIVMSVIGALNGSFALLFPLVTENGNPDGMTQVLSLLIYKEAFSNMRVGYASALSMILFLLSAVIGIMVFSISKKTVYYEV